MNKTLFTTALALVLSIGGFIASAQAADESENVTSKRISFQGGTISSTVAQPLTIIAGSAREVDLKDNLTKAAGSSDSVSFGYLLNGTQFVSLSDAMKNATVEETENSKLAAISLGKFESGDTISFGYGTNASNFNTVSLNVSADPGYYAGYKSDGFFQLDFSEDPFDGTIEILVMGEPLPASTVTLLVALGAGALLLLYRNRRTRGAEQA